MTSFLTLEKVRRAFFEATRASSIFQYRPLSGPTTIRLLVLHSGSDKAQLKASLVLDDLEDPKREYEALSYFWGPPVFSRKIKIDGTCVDITETLYDALKRLRLPNEDRVIWADAICIDQSSTEEKNRQVKLMSRIYTQCSRGIIYLGPEADGSELLYDFFNHLMDWLSRDAWSENPAWKRGAIVSTVNSLYEGLPPNEDGRWVAFRAFLRRPWFRRLWIMQEFALPRDLVTICGHWELDGTYLPTFMVAFTRVMPLGSLVDGDLDEAATQEIETAIILMRKHLSIRLAKGHSWSQMDPEIFRQSLEGKAFPQDHLRMISLVDWATKCEVTDPRDRFFGLLGLANDLDNDSSLEPDYNKSLNEIRDAYHALFIRQGHGSRLLAGARPLKALDPSQPSWTKRWNPKVDDEVCVISSAGLSRTVITPNWDRWRAAVSQVTDSSLAVRGFRIDQLHLITTKTNEVDMNSFDEVFDFNHTSTNPLSRDEFRRLAIRVLLLDKTHLDVSPVPDAFLDLCEDCIAVIRGSIALIDLVQENAPEDVHRAAEGLSHAMNALMHSRGACFGVTKQGYYGMFPPAASDGDEVFIIDGEAKTFLVRHQPDTDTYLWLGEIYVHEFEEQVKKAVTPETLTTIVVA
jgi:hypothetical protein